MSWSGNEAAFRPIQTCRIVAATGALCSSEAALVEARRTDEPWLREEAIPAGDGGWRAPSALGLAVAAALRWGAGDGDAAAGFALSVEKAADFVIPKQSF